MKPSLSFNKLPPRFAPVAFSFFMASLVSFMMSLALTAWNTGLGGAFLQRVLQAYIVGWPVAFFSVMLTRPVVVWLVGLIVAPPPQRLKHPFRPFFSY